MPIIAGFASKASGEDPARIQNVRPSNFDNVYLHRTFAADKHFVTVLFLLVFLENKSTSKLVLCAMLSLSYPEYTICMSHLGSSQQYYGRVCNYAVMV